jgi:hypothetical protein
MPLVLVPLMIALGICLVPIWLLSRRNLQRASEYFISSQPAPPEQQSAATTNRVNSRVTMMVSYERIFRITLIEFESNWCSPINLSMCAALAGPQRF